MNEKNKIKAFILILQFWGSFHNLFSEHTHLKYWLPSELFMIFLKMGYNHHLGGLLDHMPACVH
jgi:hypothetical protein